MAAPTSALLAGGGAAASAAGIPLLPLLLAGGGLGLGLFGRRDDPMDQYTELARRLRTQFGPKRMAGDVSQLFNLLSASPQFQAQLSQIMGAGARAGTASARALGRTGLSTSGIGALSRGLAESAGSFGAGQARGALFGQSLEAVLRNYGQMLQALSYGGQRINLGRGQIDPTALGGSLLQAAALSFLR